MSRKLQVMALAALGVLLAVGVALRAVFGGAPRPTHAVVVFDRSDSTRDACAAVGGVAERLLAERSWPKGSSLTLLATGDDATLGEPVELVRYAEFRRKRSVEGRSAAKKAERELLEALRAACEGVPRTATSPVYLAVRRGAEILSALDCEASRCTLAVVSDGEETVEPGLAAAIRNARPAKKAPPPSPIPSDALSVRFCGFAETVAPPPAQPARPRTRGKGQAAPARDARRADRLLSAWRSVFTRPGALEFSPICPKRKSEVTP